MDYWKEFSEQEWWAGGVQLNDSSKLCGNRENNNAFNPVPHGPCEEAQPSARDLIGPL